MIRYFEPLQATLFFLIPFTIGLLLGFRDNRLKNKGDKEKFLGDLALKVVCGFYAFCFDLWFFAEMKGTILDIHYETLVIALALAIAFDVGAYLFLKKYKDRFSQLIFVGAYVGLSLVPVICSILIYSQNNYFSDSMYQFDEDAYYEHMYIATNMFGQCTFSYSMVEKENPNEVYKNDSDYCYYSVVGNKYLFNFEGNKEEKPIECTLDGDYLTCQINKPVSSSISLERSKPSF